MSINTFIRRLLKDTAVYWGGPVKDGYGKYASFDAAVEIPCRWSDATELFTDARGMEYVSKAVVLVGQDLDEEGYLFHGTLNDLNSQEIVDPENIENAHVIKRFTKIPDIKSRQFVRKAHLWNQAHYQGG